MMNNRFEIEKPEDEWKKKLSAEAFRVLRQHGTEPPFANEYNDHHERGVYTCAGCGHPLFKSEAKYESGSGWPSFYQPIDKENLGEDIDRRFGMTRTEIHCKRCGGHIGHVFADGPRPTGLRYCTNSAALKFKGKNEDGEEHD